MRLASSARGVAALLAVTLFTAVLGVGALGHGVLNAGAHRSVQPSGPNSPTELSEGLWLAGGSSHSDGIARRSSGAHASRSAYLRDALTAKADVWRAGRVTRQRSILVTIVTEQTQQLAYRSRAP